MIMYGYAISSRFSDDGSYYITCRIPSIHGAFSKLDYRGRIPKNYVEDKDLPEYQSILLPRDILNGDVVMLSSVNSSQNEFVVIGLTGGSYTSGAFIKT